MASVGDELTLQDIFEKHPLQHGSALQCCLVNFMIDLPFMCQECPSLLTVEKLTVLYGDSGESLHEVVKERRKKGLVTDLHSPPLPLQWGTHHSKLILLIYPDCLRLCVRTFNDIFPDVHQKCNAMYVQDFPLGSTEGDFGLDFQDQLCRSKERLSNLFSMQVLREVWGFRCCAATALQLLGSSGGPGGLGSGVPRGERGLGSATASTSPGTTYRGGWRGDHLPGQFLR